VCDIYVGADAFLLVAGSIWKRGHNQIGILLVSASHVSHSAPEQARLARRAQPDTGNLSSLILKMILVTYKSDAHPGGTEGPRTQTLGFRSSAQAWRCKSGHPSGAPILKPCKLAVKPSVTAPIGAAADGRGARHVHTKTGLTPPLSKDSVGTSRKDG
jgi:hypothetical protein